MAEEEKIEKADISSILDTTSIEELIDKINPANNQKKTYLCLDSKYASFIGKKLQWKVVDTVYEAENSVNMIELPQKIKAMRMYSYVFKYHSPDTNTYTKPSSKNRFQCLVDEFRSQSFIQPDNGRFHFVGFLNDLQKPIIPQRRNASSAGLYFTDDDTFSRSWEILMGYRFDEGIYNFNKPVELSDTITLRFFDPYTEFQMPRHKILVDLVSLDYSSPGSITVRARDPHGLPYGVSSDQKINSLTISDFTTSNTVADADIITDMNTNEFTTVLVASETDFTILPNQISPPGIRNYEIFRQAPATTALVGTAQPFYVYLTCYRIIFNMELTHY